VAKPQVHPTSFISETAILEDDVVVGPFCVIHGRTRLGKGTFLESHVRIGSDYGVVELGKDNRISAGAALGGPPQDKKYNNEATKLMIGDRNQIREYVTISLGTPTGRGVTTIGDDNLIMAYSHFGHDCLIGNFNVIANSCQFAGHVELEDRVNVGGMCAFNQFVKVGCYAFIGGYSAVNKDIVPYCIAQGNYAVIRATNKIGLERSGMTPEQVESVHRAIRIITRGSSVVSEALQRIQDECKPGPQIEHLVQFIKSSKRGLAK
jgi:UDP-N-acetylglucosamine acyltransferase